MIWANFQRIVELYTQKIVKKLSKTIKLHQRCFFLDVRFTYCKFVDMCSVSKRDHPAVV
jgi:hypothetical protein